ncbi:GntR family transcriptional regulator [Oceanithermus profundus]
MPGPKPNHEIWMRLQLDDGGGLPLYQQLREHVLRMIRSGQLEPGGALPAERLLSELLGVSRLTVRKAFDSLVAEGVLVRRQGSGTFVARRFEQPLSFLSGFSQDMRARGMEPGSRQVRRVLGQATPEEALALSLSPGASVARIARVRTADGLPMAIESAVLPAEFVPDPEAVGDSLYAYLKARGLRPVRALQRLRAVAAPEEEARLLGLAPGDPVLYIQRVSFLSGGRPLEFTRSHYRGDRYDFVAELRAEP